MRKVEVSMRKMTKKQEKRIITLSNGNISYVIYINPNCVLEQLYFGKYWEGRGLAPAAMIAQIEREHHLCRNGLVCGQSRTPVPTILRKIPPYGVGWCLMKKGRAERWPF